MVLQDMRDAKIIAYKKTKVQTAIVTGELSSRDRW